MYRGIVTAGILAAGALALSAEGRAPKATAFRVRVENVSKGDTLKTSMGTAPAAVAPVLYVVHTGKNPVFTAGLRDRGLGLEALAEDGNPAALLDSLKSAAGIAAVGAQNTPVGAQAPGPIVGGNAYEFTVTAATGARLTLAMMFGQSNDIFFAPDGEGIALFKGGKPIQGDITSSFQLWDAGTELNQEPGVGPDQAPRQKAPNTGAAENGVVFSLKAVKDGFKYPAVADVLRITITPVSADSTTM